MLACAGKVLLNSCALNKLVLCRSPSLALKIWYRLPPIWFQREGSWQLGQLAYLAVSVWWHLHLWIKSCHLLVYLQAASQLLLHIFRQVLLQYNAKLQCIPAPPWACLFLPPDQPLPSIRSAHSGRREKVAELPWEEVSYVVPSWFCFFSQTRNRQCPEGTVLYASASICDALILYANNLNSDASDSLFQDWS